jgi:Cu/Ag efflux protein CusF
MGKILIFICLVIFAFLMISVFRFHGSPGKSIILAAEGEIVKIDPSSGKIDIRYSANIPECYPLLGVSKVANMKMLTGIKEGDHVLYEFNAERLPTNSTGPFLPFGKKDIISITVVTDQSQWGRKVFHCPSEMRKETGQQ